MGGRGAGYGAAVGEGRLLWGGDGPNLPPLQDVTSELNNLEIVTRHEDGLRDPALTAAGMGS